MINLLVVNNIILRIQVLENSKKLRKKIFIFDKLREGSHCRRNSIIIRYAQILLTIFQCQKVKTSTLMNHIDVIGKVEDAGLLKI